MVNLGKLKKLELRKAWTHEARDFTTWLAKEENISLLSDEIGIGIKVLQTEASVGKFNVDILAEDEQNSEHKIIIENQLEQTNHDHLGKIITYAAGYDAKIVIWIVKEARDEHKQAVDWLNEHIENIHFFIVVMELWQIEDSLMAPKFSAIVRPNDWVEDVKTNLRKIELTDTKIKQLEFWEDFILYAQKNKTKLRLQKPRPQHWYNIAVGSSNAHISLSLNTQENILCCELYIPHMKELYKKLENEKQTIEKELGLSLSWQELPDKQASRIKIARKIVSLDDKSGWNEYFLWVQNTAESFYKVFNKYIKQD